MPETETSLRTTYMDAAAALMVSGFTITDITGPDPRRLEFVFEDSDEAKDAMERHHAGTLQVPSLKYYHAVRELRERLLYVRNSLRGNGY